MTIYYCDELVDDTGEYKLMSNESAHVLCLDISEAVSEYEFQTKYLDSFEVNIDCILPTVFEMLSIKNEFIQRHDSYVSGLILHALDSGPPSYYEAMCELSNEPCTPFIDEQGDPSSTLMAIELFANALSSLGLFIYDKIKDICYTNKYLAFNIYSYENGFITLVINHVPVYRTKHAAKVMELSINRVLSKYGKTLKFE